MEKIALFIEVKYVMAFCLKRCRMMKEGEKKGHHRISEEKIFCNALFLIMLCFSQ